MRFITRLLTGKPKPKPQPTLNNRACHLINTLEERGYHVEAIGLHVRGNEHFTQGVFHFLLHGKGMHKPFFIVCFGDGDAGIDVFLSPANQPQPLSYSHPMDLYLEELTR